MEKSGVGRRINKDSMYKFCPFGKSNAAVLQGDKYRHINLPYIESMVRVRVMFIHFNKGAFIVY